MNAKTQVICHSASFRFLFTGGVPEKDGGEL
jgi:hypothetical protein